VLVRPFRFAGWIAIATLGGIAIGGCGLPDVFRPDGLKNVVIRYVGDTVLNTGQRVAPAVSVTADGETVPDPRLLFASSDTTTLALIPIGDTLVACKTGRVQLTIRLVSSMVPDSTAIGQDSIRVTGGGAPMPTCP
jgi:hypothetical protein